MSTEQIIANTLIETEGKTVVEIASEINKSRSIVYRYLYNDEYISKNNIETVEGSWPKKYYISNKTSEELPPMESVKPTAKPTKTPLEAHINSQVQIMLENSRGENFKKLENLLIGEATQHLAGTDKVLMNSLSKEENERNYSRIAFLACAVMCHAVNKEWESK